MKFLGKFTKKISGGGRGEGGRGSGGGGPVCGGGIKGGCERNVGGRGGVWGM